MITDLDLDIYNECIALKNSKNEAIFYFKNNGKRVRIIYGGHDGALFQGFLTTLKAEEGFYDIIEGAVAMHEEDDWDEINTKKIMKLLEWYDNEPLNGLSYKEVALKYIKDGERRESTTSGGLEQSSEDDV